MREDTKRRLDRLVARDRWATWLLVLAVVAVIACLTIVGFQPPRSHTQLQAIVRTAYVQIDDAGQRYLVLEVELENGQRVRVASFSLRPPEAGKPITVTEAVGWLGNRTYQWDGQTK